MKMNKRTKARKYSSSKLKGLLEEITPLEMEQTKVKMQLAIHIEELMLAKGLNKSQFAEKLGKNPSEITKWLSGTQNFTIDILTQIAHSLEVELTSLFEKPKIQVVNKTEIVVMSRNVPVSNSYPKLFGQSFGFTSSNYTAHTNLCGNFIDA